MKSFEEWCKEQCIAESEITKETCEEYLNRQFNRTILYRRANLYLEYKDELYESILHSYDKDKLYKEIIKFFGNEIVKDYHDGDPDISKYILSIKYKNNYDFINTEKFKELKNLFNYNITYINPQERFIYLEPCVPEDMTNYIYTKCKGIVWHITKNEDTKRNILLYGLKPKSSDYRNCPERIFVFASHTEDGIRKKKNGMRKLFSKDVGHKNMSLLKIDLNKYDRKLNFYIDVAMNDPYTFWTSEYIPPFCIDEVEL